MPEHWNGEKRPIARDGPFGLRGPKPVEEPNRSEHASDAKGYDGETFLDSHENLGRHRKRAAKFPVHRHEVRDHRDKQEGEHRRQRD